MRPRRWPSCTCRCAPRSCITDLRTAEMIKYASNAFLATKISFINEIANICEALGADVKEVAVGMGYDKRIGTMFLDAGLGYGGSCFPKDVKALAYMAAEKGRHPQLLHAVMEINDDRRRMAVDRMQRDARRPERQDRSACWGCPSSPTPTICAMRPSIDIANAAAGGRRPGARLRPGGDGSRPPAHARRGDVQRPCTTWPRAATP